MKLQDYLQQPGTQRLGNSKKDLSINNARKSRNSASHQHLNN